ncbi:hypothetical protein HYFRA_00010402 [Hymenoscyphus fraxineus]|uniref:FAD/NAD(P)-binding domain-containing protein n=1 Tax=Hymenoscyphus fraxineus TaxID=746836 RepID=A0A9N9L0K3_9HELO|nr:hypothetical protein HYFRA_00010402 [Hymenoscyphus fraxineus]
MNDQNTSYDVVIVGAGISGINAAYRIQNELPNATYTILEARSAIGGTWDQFRYPGIRSDSDMHVFGFEWNPYHGKETIADGADILNYIRDSAALYGIDQKVQFGQKLVEANWSSEAQSWSLLVQSKEGRRRLNGKFMLLGTGYYDYDQAAPSVIPGIEEFEGTVIHPQFWPQNFDYSGKKIVVIGSGATAVTLIPSLLKEGASHVTMLQRSPSYVLSQVSNSPTTGWLSKLIPKRWTFAITRYLMIVLPTIFLRFCERFPTTARKWLMKATAAQLPPNIPWDPHFAPWYNPWEQRLCISRNGDFYAALKTGKASIVTGKVNTVTKYGIEVLPKGGDIPENIDTDILVTATGLKIKIAGGAHAYIDGEPVSIPSLYLWKGVMLQDLPNFGYVLGYAATSWTLGADASAVHICRILKHMKKNGFTSVVPRMEEEGMGDLPVMNLSSTYMQKGKCHMPRCGDKAPWRPRDNYLVDVWEAQRGGFEGLEFM